MTKEEINLLALMDKLDFAMTASASIDPVFRALVYKGLAFERQRRDLGFEWGITDAGRGALHATNKKAAAHGCKSREETPRDTRRERG